MMDRLRLIGYQIVHWVKLHFRGIRATILRLPYQTTLLAARMIARVVPLLSLGDDRLYPPLNTCPTTAEWVAKTGRGMLADFREVDAACTVVNPLPKTIHGSIRKQFLMDHTCVYPETFVATIPNGRILNRGLVVTPDGQLVKDVSIYFHNPRITTEEAISLDWRLEKRTKICGRVAALATDGAKLYYHWLFQLLPRFELIRRAGIDPNGIDYFAVNSQKSAFQRETLAAIGIDQSRVIETEEVHYIQAEEIVVPSIPLSSGCYPPWMIEFLRTSLLSRDHASLRPSGRRLYISRARAAYRRVLNEADVIQLLLRRGFEVATFETLSVREQAAIIASCEVIVAPHGGGLSNLAFCSPGAKVIEIFSPELVAGYFWRICTQLNLDYYYLLGKGRPESLLPDYPQSWNAAINIEVDLAALQQTLDLAIVH